MLRWTTPFILFFFTSLSAQTYFYVESLEIEPSAPTVEDEVYIRVIGGLSSTGAHITGYSAMVNGFGVDLDIDCADPGGAAVIVPHDTLLFLGEGLAAGDYLIQLGGLGLGDFVQDAEDYEFTVFGPQSVEDLFEERFEWHWNGEELDIHEQNGQNFRVIISDLRGRVVEESTQAGGESYRWLRTGNAEALFLVQIEFEGHRFVRKIK